MVGDIVNKNPYLSGYAFDSGKNSSIFQSFQMKLTYSLTMTNNYAEVNESIRLELPDCANECVRWQMNLTSFCI